MNNSKSLYINENNSNKIHLDDFGRPLNEVRIDGDAYDKDKTKYNWKQLYKRCCIRLIYSGNRFL